MDGLSEGRDECRERGAGLRGKLERRRRGMVAGSGLGARSKVRRGHGAGVESAKGEHEATHENRRYAVAVMVCQDGGKIRGGEVDSEGGAPTGRRIRSGSRPLAQLRRGPREGK